MLYMKYSELLNVYNTIEFERITFNYHKVNLIINQLIIFTNESRLTESLLFQNYFFEYLINIYIYKLFNAIK